MTDHIQVRARKGAEAPKEHEKLVDILMEKADLPCDFPSYLFWPRGERRLTDRALILMQAGLEHLKNVYPKSPEAMPVLVKETTPAIKTPARAGATAEREPPSGW